ncbi:MAG: hypothetical protein FJY99_10500 [Candidatus Sericytochromatia bacterium]|nr:hypothetical protein [Candidatus Tanganyikabacteria bacterium]
MSTEAHGPMASGRPPLGEVLLRLRRLDPGNLEAALREQRDLNIRLGDLLLQKGLIDAETLEEALTLQERGSPDAPASARRRLGERLLAQGRITSEQLASALESQALSKARIGEILVEMGFVTTEEVDRALKATDALGLTSRTSARSAPGTAPLGQRTQPLELARPDVADAFRNVFGRVPAGGELEAYRGRLAAAGTRNKQELLFRHVVADRIVQLAGGDLVTLTRDADGEPVLRGLSPEDLALARSLAVDSAYDAAKASQAFLARSLRVSFRRAIGRDPAAGAEEAFWAEAWSRGEAAGFLEAWTQAWQRFLAEHPLLRKDPAAILPFLPGPDELRESLALFRARHGDDFFAALMAGAYFNARRIEARQVEQGRQEVLSSLREGQVRKRLEQLLADFLGTVPPALAQVLAQWIQAAGGGMTAEGPAVLERLLVDLLERLMAILERHGGTDPARLGKALEAALEMLASGLVLTDQLLEALVTQASAGESAEGGDAVAAMRAQVDQMLFDMLGQIEADGPAAQNLVDALVSGTRDLHDVRSSLERQWRSGLAPFSTEDAQAFVAHLNLLYRGLAFMPGPDDDWVRQLLAREVLPAEVARHWAAEVAVEVP